MSTGSCSTAEADLHTLGRADGPTRLCTVRIVGTGRPATSGWRGSPTNWSDPIRRLTLAAALWAAAFTFSAVNVLANPNPNPIHRRHPTICTRAYTLRVEVKARYAPKWVAGRNICRDGIPTAERPRGLPRKATTKERARYLRALEALARPTPPFLAVVPGAPKIAPAGTLTVHYQPIGLAACIVRVESGGNPQADTDGVHKGAGQWDDPTWISQGGGRFGPSALYATFDEQMEILSFGLVRDGCAPWCPFEGGQCG